MTVEQAALPLQTQRPQEKNSDFAKIREVTGIDDYQRIHKAIKACQNPSGDYEINEVINVLITQETVPNVSAAAVPVSVDTAVEEGAQERGDCAKPAPYFPTSDQPNKGGTPVPGSVIDLTSEGCENEQLQKAIAESLKDTPAILGGQLTREEQEISRVLEQSLHESKAGTKRKRGDLWFVDPLNPHERKRKDGWPVGLKNVGNTCWFSAVIQSLFHIPMFRQLILNYVSPDADKTGKLTARRNVQFVCELRKLFALLVGTCRKYVDPSDAVEILKEAFSANAGSSDNQQDVSEFQHRLLEWLEDAFRTQPGSAANQSQQSTSHGGSKEKEPSNPMVQLFYGQYMAEGMNEGKSFTKTETFGQFPLQVEGFGDLHASLEGATAQGEIETVSMDVTSKSGQELWFTRLPLVLTFELSRFQFNQQFGCPEKIHKKLDFPEIIYMDRYMLCNKCITRQKREEVKRLTDRLKQLQAKLDKFVNYGSGAKRFPLEQVLQYALEFAENRGHLPLESDVEMESPKSQSSMQTDSPAAAAAVTSNAIPPDVTMGTMATTTPPRPVTSRVECPGVDEERPSPRHVTSAELAVLQSCLQRWREEVELDVKELQQQISKLETTIGSMYAEEQLQKYSYRLHAVLVHEGEAVSGHYWAYVRPDGRRWLKFNDISVTDASWAELWREGAGGGAASGTHHTSAYCLVYTDSRSEQLFKDVCPLAADSDGSETANSLRRQQRAATEAFVAADNEAFQTEIAEWDDEEAERRRRVDATTTLATTAIQIGDGPQVNVVNKSPLRSFVYTSLDSLQEQHANLAASSTYRLVEEAAQSEKYVESGPLATLKEACDRDVTRLTEAANGVTSRLPRRDQCLANFVIYLLANGVHRRHVWYAQLEQVALLKTIDAEPRSKEVRQCAYEEMKRLHSVSCDEDRNEYKKWHADYSKFRLAAKAFAIGVDDFYKENYVEALPYLVFACDQNAQLNRTGGGSLLNFDPSLLGYFRRQCLLHLNEAASAQFVTDDEPTECLSVMTRLVLPSLPALNATGLASDQAAIEDIRGKWCLFLNQQLEGYKVEKLQDCLSRLLEEPHEDDVRTAFPRDSLQLSDTGPAMLVQYTNAMDLIEQHGDSKRDDNDE